MAYYIAVASSNGTTVDIHFGAASEFRIYRVEDDASFSFAETRAAPEETAQDSQQNAGSEGAGTGCGNADAGCGGGTGAGGGCGGAGGGCGGGAGQSAKVASLSDCRAVVCKKIGFNVQKQLEKKAIAGFDVECAVEDALKKITQYFYKIDNHISLAKR